METLGIHIRNARKAQELTQEGLAFKIGATKATISKYELGHRTPNLTVLSCIAKALNTTVGDLITGTDITWQRLTNGESDTETRLWDAFSQLNDIGQQKAVERVEELTELTKYRITQTD